MLAQSNPISNIVFFGLVYSVRIQEKPSNDNAASFANKAIFLYRKASIFASCANGPHFFLNKITLIDEYYDRVRVLKLVKVRLR